MLQVRSVSIGIVLVLSLLIVIGGAAQVFAEEESQLKKLTPYFIGTIVVAVILAVMLSLMAETKGSVRGKTEITRYVRPGSQPGLSEKVNKLAGKGAKTEEIMRVVDVEMSRKISSSAQELRDKYDMIIDEKDKKLELMSQEYNLAQEEVGQVAAAKRQTESIVRNIADGLVVVNEKGEVQMLNAVAQKLLDVDDKNSIINKRLMDNLKGEQVISMLGGSAGDKERTVEFGGADDDSKAVVRTSAAVIEDEQGNTIGIISVPSGVTARKEAERALKASEARLRKLIETNADGMIVVDRKGIIRFGNRAAELLFERSAVEFVGTQCWFSISAGERKELKFEIPGGISRVAELNVVETEWEKDDALLVSLRDVTEMVRLREELEHISLSDELTKVYNRRGFITLVEQQLKMANQKGNKPILFFIDLDKMKWINDNLGHHEGDRALIATTDILRKTFRETDIIGRMGGDEFAVFAIEPPPKGGAGILGAAVQDNVDAWNEAAQDNPFQLSVSVGIANYDPQHPRSIEDLLFEADEAMYHQKRARHEMGNFQEKS